MSNYFPLEIQRNADFVCGLKFEDKITGDPLDITDWDFALQVKQNEGLPGPVIAYALFSDVVGPDGTINMAIRGADFSSVSGYQEKVVLAFDLLVRDALGYIVCQMRGPLYLLPGVSTI